MNERCDENLIRSSIDAENSMTENKKGRKKACSDCGALMEDTGKVRYSEILREPAHVYYCPECQEEHEVVFGGEKLELPDKNKK